MHSAPGHPKVSGAERGGLFTANYRPVLVACAVFQNLATSLVPSARPAALDPSSFDRLVPSPELRSLRPGTYAPVSRPRVGQLAVRSSASTSGRSVPPPLARPDSKKNFLGRQPRKSAGHVFFKNSLIRWPFPAAIREGKPDFDRRIPVRGLPAASRQRPLQRSVGAASMREPEPSTWARRRFRRLRGAACAAGRRRSRR